jgi:hypothetical protein
MRSVDGWSLHVKADVHHVREGERVLVECSIEPEWRQGTGAADCSCLTAEAARVLADALLEQADVADKVNAGAGWVEAWNYARERAEARRFALRQVGQ